jgi:hypothetical protein
MAKSIVVLMLLIAQVFAGSFGVQSICLKHDGSFCCIDHGAETCRCCQHEEIAKAECTCCRHDDGDNDVRCCAIESNIESLADRHADDSSSSPYYIARVTVGQNTSGCKHIPISASPATTAQRVVIADVLVQASFWIFVPSQLNGDELLVVQQFHPILHGPPRAEVFALIAFSSTMLRC